MCCLRAQKRCARTQSVDLCQQKATFFIKMSSNPLRKLKIVVPLHRQSEMMTFLIEKLVRKKIRFG